LGTCNGKYVRFDSIDMKINEGDKVVVTKENDHPTRGHNFKIGDEITIKDIDINDFHGLPYWGENNMGVGFWLSSKMVIKPNKQHGF